MSTRKQKLEALADEFVIGQQLDRDHQQVLSRDRKSQKDCRVGIYDLKQQKLVVPTEFGNAHLFAPGFYLVRKGNKVGVYSEGSHGLVLDIVYDTIEPPQNGNRICKVTISKKVTEWKRLPMPKPATIR